MLGIIKIQHHGIVAKSGFKYIRLDPKMTFFSERNAIAYIDQVYDFIGDKLYIYYSEKDIYRETMTAIFLNNCQPLNMTQISGECKINTGFKCLVFNENLSKLAPVISRRISGPQEFRLDVFAYSKKNYLKIIKAWNRSGSTITIESSATKELDKKIILDKLEKENPVLYHFVMLDYETANLLIPVVNQEFTNRQHLQRFCRKYSTLFVNLYGIDPYDFKNLDVIDLENISIVRISDPEDLNNYRVLDFLTNSVKIVGKGFSKLDSIIPDEKFVYLFVDNCVYHRIHVMDRKTVLFIKTQKIETIKDLKERSFLLIKFNKYCLKHILSRIEIQKFNDSDI
jgi:hypothetical protein